MLPKRITHILDLKSFGITSSSRKSSSVIPLSIAQFLLTNATFSINVRGCAPLWPAWCWIARASALSSVNPIYNTISLFLIKSHSANLGSSANDREARRRWLPPTEMVTTKCFEYQTGQKILTKTFFVYKFSWNNRKFSIIACRVFDITVL